uniref:Uncharacterized protein n=1 Tax=Physcomitrium patens TaxID=3218 RepID=A0A2K1KF53_PHYPA|nr:hypothetical protein PHYPA_008781 [Physcomitrium patens]
MKIHANSLKPYVFTEKRMQQTLTPYRRKCPNHSQIKLGVTKAQPLTPVLSHKNFTHVLNTIFLVTTNRNRPVL